MLWLDDAEIPRLLFEFRLASWFIRLLKLLLAVVTSLLKLL